MTRRRGKRQREQDNSNAPIFDPELGDGLIKILNELDPISFINFTRTCKDSYNFCRYAKGINVFFGRDSSPPHLNDFLCRVVVSSSEQGEADVRMFQVCRRKRRDRRTKIVERPFTNEDIQALLKMPFTIEIECIEFRSFIVSMVSPQIVNKLCQFLRAFPRLTIKIIRPCYVENWNAFSQLVQEFEVKSMEHYDWYDDNWQIPLDVLPVFLNNLDDFSYDKYVPDEFILSATSKLLHLSSARISTDTFWKLVKRFCDGDFESWTIGTEGENFHWTCRDGMEIITSETIDWANAKPSVLYTTIESPNKFYFINPRGSKKRIFVDRTSVTFSNAPACFKCTFCDSCSDDFP